MTARLPDDYSDLITQFHIHRPKFHATVRALAQAAVQIGETAASLPEAFDLDSAIGVQLDAVGKWIGRDRFIPYPLDTFWFSLDDFVRGLDMAVWKTSYDADYGTYRLADEDFRRLLYAQIGMNYWDGTMETLRAVLLDFYEGMANDPNTLFFLDDRADGSATLAVSGAHPAPIVRAMLAWPAVRVDVGGIEIRVRMTSVNDAPLFGFDVQNNYVAGFDAGAFGVDPIATLFLGDPSQMDFSDPDYSALIGGI